MPRLVEHCGLHIIKQEGAGILLVSIVLIGPKILLKFTSKP